MFDSIANSDELTQLVLIEFIRKDAVINSGNKVCFIGFFRWWGGFSHIWIGQISPINL